ncbi:MAG: hypothetical protein J6M60_02715 [Clostridia bacterium]|nr:hypothetical protein [Clostridia bacterium]
MEEYNEQNIPEAYKPLGAWAFFGWTLLFNLPFVGWIIVIVFSCGVSSRKNLTNYARSILIMWGFAILVSIIYCIAMFALGFSVGLLDALY